MNWLIPANIKQYDFINAFKELKILDWTKKANYNVGDIVYIYGAKPYQKIIYKTEVIKIDVKYEDTIDDSKYWVNRKIQGKPSDNLYTRLKLMHSNNSNELLLDDLITNGLKRAPQGPMKLNNELLSYIEKCFYSDMVDTIIPEQLPEEESLYEGIGVTIKVNSYERSGIARRKCIEYHGSHCKVCGFNFEEVYGNFAKDYIHVHHIVPLSQINDKYKVDYKNDLIPVCPNCHAMLHKKRGSGYLTVEQLRGIINR